MRKSIVTVLVSLFVCGQSSYSQISTNELPLSVQRGLGTLIKGNSNGTISLPVPDIKKILQEDSINYEKESNAFKRTAVSIPIVIDITKDGVWSTLDNGGRLWQIEIQAEKALALDFVFSNFWLPQKGKFFLFNPLTRESIGAITSKYLLGKKNNPHRFSTGILRGDKIILEYYQPAEEEDFPVIKVEKAYYTYIPTPNFLSPSTCSYEVNVNCSEGNNWHQEKNAVALVYIKNNYESGWASGSLLNNLRNNLAPLFLTANHCLISKDAIYGNDLSDWVFYWGYELDNCQLTTQPNYYNKTTTGATIIANNSYSDFALLQLQQDPINIPGYIPYYLGWDASGYSGTGGVCIHHPNHDVKKISTYDCTPQTVSYNSSPEVYWGVQWIATANGHGITEQGSSGSPLINNNHKVIGQLCGGFSNCSNLIGTDKYGKISVSWTGNDNNDYRRRLNHWLDPDDTGIQSLNGLNPFRLCGPSFICSPSVGVYNIENLPSFYTVIWTIDESDFSINQSGNQCSVTYIGSQDYGTATLTASIYYNNAFIKQFSETIRTGTPELGFLMSNNHYGGGNWIEGNAGNTVAVVGGSNPFYNRYECNIYRLNDQFQEVLVRHEFSSFPSFELTTAFEGWYIAYIRGINDCGYSEWSCIEIETEAPNSGPGHGDTQCIIIYNPDENNLTVRCNKSPHFGTSATLKDLALSSYEVQIWNKNKLIKTLYSNEQETIVSLTSLPKDFYIAKVIRNGKNYTKKFFIR